jgi:hypothetical protein
LVYGLYSENDLALPRAPVYAVTPCNVLVRLRHGRGQLAAAAQDLE